jgi:hypothetical protein
MKNKKTETEYANEKINDYFNEDNDAKTMEIDPLLTNNNRSLVLKNQEQEKLIPPN